MAQAAQTLEAMFYQGNQVRVDHTPSGAALTTGKIVDLGNQAGVCTSPEGIADGVLGSVDIDGIYKVKKAVGTGVVFANGADVFWDTVGLTAVAAAGANIIRLGMATEAAVTGDNHVKTWINRDGVQA